MDGRFVPNLTLGPVVVEAVKRSTSLPLDVHLMIVEPERYVDDFVRAGAATIGVQVEACRHLHRTLAQIKEAGARACVVLNPATPPDALEYVARRRRPGAGDDREPRLRRAAVHRGDAAQDRRDPALDRRARARGETRGGRRHLARPPSAAPPRAGAERFVAGTAVFGAKDYAKAIRELRETAERALERREAAQPRQRDDGRRACAGRLRARAAALLLVLAALPTPGSRGCPRRRAAPADAALSGSDIYRRVVQEPLSQLHPGHRLSSRATAAGTSRIRGCA